jgi:ferrochelatase
MKYSPEPPYRHGTQSAAGILLVNLGTPDAPTPSAVRRYLKEFLSDPRVVEIPRAAWWLILNGIILNVRPAASARKYAAVWTPEGSPLRVHTERQARLLTGFLGERIRSPLTIEWAMRYGTPSIADAIARLKAKGCDRILVLPLYPQYAASTTASVFDEVARCLSRTRNLPAIRMVRSFHDHPGYIAALAASIRKHWSANGQPDKLLFSFHGLPRYTLERGDPYHCECHKTARLLAEALQLPEDRWQISFQSRFGRTEWLKPYTSEVLAELARSGARRVDVACPGFASDCLETLEEIGIEAKSGFLAAGGKEFHLIPCLNEDEPWIHALADIARSNLGDWASETWDSAAAQALANQSAQRALKRGAPASG